ncbi:MAG: type III pantothenate kinase, partial [Magnetococcales bacterium]|nr:type III pantothenate kinase [Magnetococcales bacterium]
MLLVVDIGNTNIVLGLYQGDKLENYWRLATQLQTTDDQYGILLHNLFTMSGVTFEQVNGVILSSVAPPVESAFVRGIQRHMKRRPLVVGPGLRTGMRIVY